MSWKPSKRQAQLKKRLINSSRVYWETSHTLDQMLLKMLHNNNVYTPDDFYNKYIKSNDFNLSKANHKHNLPTSHSPYYKIHNSTSNSKRSINQTLIDLDRVLHQLKHIINSKH